MSAPEKEKEELEQTPAAESASVEAGAEDPGEELEKLRADLHKFQDLALRSQADLDNFRKRMLREKEETIRYANANLLERLLPILDSFELGLQAAGQSDNAADLTKGFALVQKQLQDFLRDHGVEPIEAVGQPFDPNLHEAVGQMPSPEVPEGHVLQQIRKGYRLRERLVRPATVLVSKGPENPA